MGNCTPSIEPGHNSGSATTARKILKSASKPAVSRTAS